MRKITAVVLIIIILAVQPIPISADSGFSIDYLWESVGETFRKMKEEISDSRLVDNLTAQMSELRSEIQDLRSRIYGIIISFDSRSGALALQKNGRVVEISFFPETPPGTIHFRSVIKAFEGNLEWHPEVRMISYELPGRSAGIFHSEDMGYLVGGNFYIRLESLKEMGLNLEFRDKMSYIR